MTLAQWLREWLRTIRAEISPKSQERYGEIVENFLIPKIGNLPLVKLAPTHIQTVYNGWAMGGRLDGKEGGLSPLTRRCIHSVLRSALARAVEQQLLARSPADAFKKETAQGRT
jgi:hypothetical protein